MKKDDIKKTISKAKQDYKEMGGWKALKTEKWIEHLIQKTFSNYWKNANVEYLTKKYKTNNKEKLAQKLILIATKQASLLGGITGAAISANEITAIATGGAVVGINLSANITIALASLGIEAISLVRIQLELVANLGKLYEVQLDPKDPEDSMTILAFALGSKMANTAGKMGMKIGGQLAGNLSKAVFKKETLTATKRIGAKIGVEILQKSIVKYTIPIISIGIGTTWNYIVTKNVGKIAIKHFKKRIEIAEGD